MFKYKVRNVRAFFSYSSQSLLQTHTNKNVDGNKLGTAALELKTSNKRLCERDAEADQDGNDESRRYNIPV